MVQLGDGPVHVVSSKADQMFLDILQSGKAAGLLHFSGDLELTNHSAGSLTSQAEHKRWNRKNELLADAAERASVAAEWMGGPAYPQQRLNEAWRLVLGGQFHDIMAGTATPKSYEYSWNDDVIAMNQFAGVLTSASAAIAAALNTQVEGQAVVVYNPLNIERQDVVEATVPFAQGATAKRSRHRPGRQGSPLAAASSVTCSSLPRCLPLVSRFTTSVLRKRLLPALQA